MLEINIIVALPRLSSMVVATAWRTEMTSTARPRTLPALWDLLLAAGSMVLKAAHRQWCADSSFHSRHKFNRRSVHAVLPTSIFSLSIDVRNLADGDSRVVERVAFSRHESPANGGFHLCVGKQGTQPRGHDASLPYARCQA